MSLHVKDFSSFFMFYAGYGFIYNTPARCDTGVDSPAGEWTIPYISLYLYRHEADMEYFSP